MAIKGLLFETPTASEEAEDTIETLSSFPEDPARGERVMVERYMQSEIKLSHQPKAAKSPGAQIGCIPERRNQCSVHGNRKDPRASSKGLGVSEQSKAEAPAVLLHLQVPASYERDSEHVRTCVPAGSSNNHSTVAAAARAPCLLEGVHQGHTQLSSTAGKARQGPPQSACGQREANKNLQMENGTTLRWRRMCHQGRHRGSGSAVTHSGVSPGSTQGPFAPGDNAELEGGWLTASAGVRHRGLPAGKRCFPSPRGSFDQKKSSLQQLPNCLKGSSEAPSVLVLQAPLAISSGHSSNDLTGILQGPNLCFCHQYSLTASRLACRIQVEKSQSSGSH
ncbi:hypothetical protein Anapl_07546 [Anas platyrhynchos]|uniref:Uncharacterized protein n=1 Tax=Anas platyrhynchos TaxID=8839 RepID=R0K6X1_ANAPL|nr:hypothetical protein Anapl_07546 [Anas platyrhynchos]